MAVNREECPLALDNPAEIGRLREVLDRADFTPKTIAELLRVRSDELASFQGRVRNHAILVQRCAGGSPLDTLVRLFLLGVTVDRAALRQALAPANLDYWLTAGLLRERGDGVAAAFQLTPFEQLLLAVDPLWTTDRSHLHVLSVGSPTFLLSQMTIRRPARHTLDVGAGNGIQSFLAAPHSAEVIGVDRNPRAVNVATFNAQLNGIANTTFLEGDLYSPVRDRRFDLIVANPPYVISPESRFMFRDSGLKGDEISQRVIREGVGLLEEGGYLQLICEWANLVGQDWRSRLAGWFEGSGCDVCVFRFTNIDTLSHAEVWLKPDPQDPADDVPKRLQVWLDYYKQQRIETISDGVITLRKRAGANHWLRFDDAPQRIGPCGPALQRSFVAADFLAANYADEALLAARLRLAAETALDQVLLMTTAGWRPDRQQLFLRGGLAYRGEVDPRCAALLERCRGERTLRQVLDDLAQSGLPHIEQADALTVVRGLVEQGFLLPQ